MADRRPTAPSPSFGIQPPHAASTAMAPPPPQPTSSAEPRGTSPPAAAGSSSSSSSSLLHLLAAASSDLPAKISSSYHLHELPAAGSPRSNTSGTPGVQPAGAEGGASATSNGSGPAGASACGAAGPSGLKRKASSSVGPEEKKEIKNGNNKVTLSCAECRRLKLKCDRVWPCSNCKKRGVATICPNGELKGGKGKRLILADTEELHARISALESALHESHAQLTRAGGVGVGSRSSGGEASREGAGTTHPLLDSSFHYEPLDGGSSAGAGEDHAAEGAGASGSGARLAGGPGGAKGKGRELLNPAERGVGEDNIGRLSAGRFFGGSAGSAYLLSESASPTATPPETTPYGSSHASPQFGGSSSATSALPSSAAAAAAAHSAAVASAGIAREMDLLLAQLPSREQAWALSDSYFRNGSWMYCVIKRRTFDNDFFPLAFPSVGAGAGRPAITPHQLALFFMVLCLGALFDLNSAPYNQLSKRYYALAKAALALDSAGSVVHVQTIMLMGTLLLNEHSHATRGGEEFWPLLGLAMKHAVALGLHRDGQNWNLPKEEVDERRRVFFELDVYETLQALCLGRPRSLASHAIDTKAPGSNSEEDMKSESIFHQAKYKLLPLIKRVNDLQVQTTPTTYDQIITLDQEFRAFERKLPAELHCSEDSCVLPTDGNGWIDKTFILQRHAMLIMINESLLFLHRGWFARALRDFPDEPLKARWSRSYIAELESCKTIISVVKDVLQLQGSLVTRHWFFFFHAFSASTSLAVSVIRAPSSSLALSAFQELENGVALFESARVGSRPRDELPILKRLRDRAAEKLVLHRSGKKSKKVLKPANDGLTDDLDLIGDDSHRRRSGPHGQPAVGRPASATTATPLAAEQASLPNSVPMHDLPPDALEQMNLVAAQFSLPAEAGSAGSPDQPLLATPGQDGFFFPTTLDEAIAAQPNFPSDFNEFSSWTSDPNFGMGAAGAFGYGEPERLGMYPAAGGGPVHDFDFDSFMQGMR